MNSLICDAIRTRSILRFNQSDPVIQSALSGQGIALGRVELIAPLLREGRLAALSTPRPGPESANAYWLLQAEPTPRPAVQAVLAWLLAEARA